jgi:hypothetical protein
MASPVHTIKQDKVQAAIWKNTKSDEKTYYTVSFSRAFRQDDETKFTQSFGLYDLGHLITCAGMALTWIWKRSLKDRAASEKAA